MVHFEIAQVNFNGSNLLGLVKVSHGNLKNNHINQSTIVGTIIALSPITYIYN